MIATIQSQYPNVTGAKDTTSGIVKYVKRANALQKILSAVYSFITTQDDMIGNAVEDVVVGQFIAGANWIVKGESNKTNGWLKLEMR
jgi:isopentenyl phosphate kinase